MTWPPELVERYVADYAALTRVAFVLLGSRHEAEEVVQDSFVAMHDRWRRLDDPEKGLAYLRQTVVNRSRSVLRHRTVRSRHAAGLEHRPAVGAHPGADEQTLAAERRREVLAAMRDLPDRQREVIALRYYLDLSEAQIADTLGISRGAVKSHASRGVASLRHLLKDAS